MASLDGQAFVITGGASGIGLATARLLRDRGARLSLWDRDAQALARVAPELAAQTHVLDVTDAAAVAATLAQTLAAFSSLRGVIHSAGILRAGPFDQVSLAAYRRLIDVNLFGSTAVAHAALPALRESRGSLILLASVSAFAESGEYAVYGAVKAGVVALANTLRVELHGSGVHVGVVVPMFVATPLLADEAVARTRLLRGYGTSHTPEAVAQAVVRGIARRRWMIWPSWHPWLVYQVGRLLPLRWRSQLWWAFWRGGKGT